MMSKLIFTSFLLSISYQIAIGQQALDPKPSPLASINMRYKDAYIKVVYSQPHKRGREVFGHLVPYGKVWRTGANEATEITLTKDMLINNQILKAGTYSLFTIPEKEKWTIIINSELGLWGSYNYNSKLDVARFEVPVQALKNMVYEPFTMQFDQKNEMASLLMFWDNIKITIPLKFIN